MFFHHTATTTAAATGARVGPVPQYDPEVAVPQGTAAPRLLILFGPIAAVPARGSGPVASAGSPLGAEPVAPAVDQGPGNDQKCPSFPETVAGDGVSCRSKCQGIRLTFQMTEMAGNTAVGQAAACKGSSSSHESRVCLLARGRRTDHLPPDGFAGVRPRQIAGFFVRYGRRHDTHAPDPAGGYFTKKNKSFAAVDPAQWWCGQVENPKRMQRQQSRNGQQGCKGEHRRHPVLAIVISADVAPRV